MILERRALLRIGGAALVTGVAGNLTHVISKASAAPVAVGTPGRLTRDVRQVSFQALHTGETLNVDYWANGCYDSGSLKAINHILRDFRTNEVHVIDPKLLDLLHNLRTQLETNAPLQVISGYRSPITNEMLHEKSNGVAAKSLHMSGMAIDIRLPGRSLGNLHNAALAMGQGGVGYYPTSDFVHVDVGRVRKWVGT